MSSLMTMRWHCHLQCSLYMSLRTQRQVFSYLMSWCKPTFVLPKSLLPIGLPPSLQPYCYHSPHSTLTSPLSTYFCLSAKRSNHKLSKVDDPCSEIQVLATCWHCKATISPFSFGMLSYLPNQPTVAIMNMSMWNSERERQHLSGDFDGSEWPYKGFWQE